MILAAGASDADKHEASEVLPVAKKAIERLKRGFPEADLLLLSPFTNGVDDTKPVRAPVQSLADGLKTLAAQERVRYLDVTGYLPLRVIGVDGTHQ